MNATPTNPPLSLHLGLGDGPSLLHPPRGQVWWAFADGDLGVWDGCRTYRLGGGRVTIDRAEAPWSPEPAGRVFRDHEMLFRRTPGGLRAIATMKPGSRFLEGPEGAALIRDGDAWTRAAAPRCDAQPLVEPLAVNPWGVRWSSGGGRLSVGDEYGATLVIDISTGREVERHVDALPVDGDGGLLHEDGRLEVGGVRWVGIREATCAFDGRLLAGPGGVVWDLSTGERLFHAPVVPLGAVIPGERWLLVPWDTGQGLWLDPLTGATWPGPVFDDEPDAAESHGGADLAVFSDLDLPVQGCARVGSRIWGWSEDGLLVAV